MNTRSSATDSDMSLATSPQTELPANRESSASWRSLTCRPALRLAATTAVLMNLFVPVLPAGAQLTGQPRFTTTTSGPTREAGAVPGEPGAVITAPRSVGPGGMSFVTTLADLQYDAGLAIDTVDATNTLFFPLPRDAKTTGGTLRLWYMASPMLHSSSNLRIYVNGFPRASVPLAGKTTRTLVTIPLRPTDMDKRFVEVTIRSALVHSVDRCLDERVNAGYLHIFPESGLTLNLSSALIPSIRAYWERLPNRVTISVSGSTVNPASFQAAWRLGDLLARQGKKVRFARLPEVGHIVVAPDWEVSGLASGSPGTAPAGSASSPAPITKDTTIKQPNLQLRSAGGRQFIALTEPYVGLPIHLLSPQWIEVARGQQYTAYPLDTEEARDHKRYSFAFGDLGLKDSARIMGTSASWELSVSPHQLPSRYRPRELRLQVVSSPGLLDRPVDRPVMFASYVNGNLLQVQRLPDDGKPHEIVVPLPPERLGRHNAFKFTAHRAEVEGDCKRTLASYPIQILPTSVVLADYQDRAPEQFSELSSYLGDRFTTFVPRSYLNSPGTSLDFVTRLSNDMALQLRNVQVQFYDEGKDVNLDTRFLLLGKPSAGSVSGPLHFDRGRVQIVSSDNQMLLDVDRLPGVVVAQLARAGGMGGRVNGLWLAPGGNSTNNALFTPKTLILDQGDLAFVDDTGELLHLDSASSEIAAVAYPESRDWFSRLGAYRYWLFAAFWVALTLLFIWLFRLARRPRNV